MTDRRSVLISGASTGSGLAVAHRFAGAGWDVWAGVRSDEDAEKVSSTHNIRAVHLDVTDSASVSAVVAELQTERGDLGLDVLVNNAGIVHAGPLEYIEIEEWYQQFEVNFFGVVRLTREALPALRCAVDPRIIMVGSINSRLGVPLLGPYVSSKHALAGLCASLRRELAPSGPLVTLIEPGAVRTEIWPKAADTAARLESELPREALERYRDPIEAHKVHLRGGDHGGVDPDHVAAVIENIVTSPHPPARRLVGRDAQIGGALGRLVPDKVMEALGRVVQRRALREADA